jgi:hypothetical protein
VSSSRVQTLRHIRLESSRLAVKARELFEAEQSRLEKRPRDMEDGQYSDWLDSLCDALDDAVSYADGAVKELEGERQ